MANRRIYNVLRKSVILTDRQRSIVFGTLLGDGSLTETGSKKNLRLQLDHSDAQKQYVLWKYEELKTFVLSPPSYQKWTRSWRFRTISHPELTEIGKLFYHNRKKVVPREIQKFLNPLSIAVWFMDDGSNHRSGYILNTQSFEKDDSEFLRKVLSEQYNIVKTTLHLDHGRWRLYIQASEKEKFRKLIEPYILQELAYKLGAL